MATHWLAGGDKTRFDLATGSGDQINQICLSLETFVDKLIVFDRGFELLKFSCTVSANI